MRDLTPIIIGVGEASERIDAPDYEGVSPAELAGRAARAACEDALAVDKIAPAIDLIATIRQFEVSGPTAKPPFGGSDNFPRSVAKRIGADPKRAILEVTGGQGPQHLVNEFAQAIAAGEVEMALFAGSEAISTVRHLQGKGESRDWAESPGGPEAENRGFGVDGLVTAPIYQHGLRIPITVYAACENARRARKGMDRASYAREMGELFAPFTKVAHTNPHAMSQEVYSAEELATVTAKNRLVADPFPRRMVARDQANQGAAVILTSVAKARELGVPEEKWVYLHGGADAKERTVAERQDLSKSPAAVRAVEEALKRAGKSFEDLGVLDLYSCFPIAVFNITDAFGVRADDPRGLTVTGGLPFFGGAGNNYSMHAIASMIRALRAKPGAYGLVGANGGFLSKYSVGVYSTAPSEWKGFDSKALQAEIDAWPAPPINEDETSGTIETYTIDYGGPQPRGIAIGKTPGGKRFVAMADGETLEPITQAMIDHDPLGGQVTFKIDEKGRSILQTFTPAA